MINGSAQEEETWIEGREQFRSALAEKVHTVSGVDAVVYGHVVDYRTFSGNHAWIDAQFHTGSLTILVEYENDWRA